MADSRTDAVNELIAAAKHLLACDPEGVWKYQRAEKRLHAAIEAAQSTNVPSASSERAVPDGLVLCNDGNYAVDIGTNSPTYGWLLQRGLNKNWFTCRKAFDDEITRAKTHHRIASSMSGWPVATSTSAPQSERAAIPPLDPTSEMIAAASQPAAHELGFFCDAWTRRAWKCKTQCDGCFRKDALRTHAGSTKVPEACTCSTERERELCLKKDKCRKVRPL